MDIKNRCIIHSPDKMIQMKRLKESKMDTMMSMAKTRKEKMKIADMNRAANEKPNDLSLE